MLRKYLKSWNKIMKQLFRDFSDKFYFYQKSFNEIDLLSIVHILWFVVCPKRSKLVLMYYTLVKLSTSMRLQAWLSRCFCSLIVFSHNSNFTRMLMNDISLPSPSHLLAIFLLSPCYYQCTIPQYYRKIATVSQFQLVWCSVYKSIRLHINCGINSVQ